MQCCCPAHEVLPSSPRRSRPPRSLEQLLGAFVEEVAHLGADRAELRNRLSLVHVPTAASQPAASEPEAVVEGFDWSKSTRDNFQCDPRSSAYGQYQEAYRDIRCDLDHAYHGVYTLERQAVQDALVEEVLAEGVAEGAPWVVFTAGAMGAGKSRTMSWLSENRIFPLSQVVQVDADLFKAALPEWEGYVARDPMSAGFHTRQESGMCCEIAQEAAMRAGRHLWVDGSLRDGAWYVSVFQKIRRTHPEYRIAIFHITASKDLVVERARQRGQATGRHVPMSEILDSMQRVPAAVELLSPYTNFVATIDNSSDVPRLVHWADFISAHPAAAGTGLPPRRQSWVSFSLRRSFVVTSPNVTVEAPSRARAASSPAASSPTVSAGGSAEGSAEGSTHAAHSVQPPVSEGRVSLSPVSEGRVSSSLVKSEGRVSSSPDQLSQVPAASDPSNVVSELDENWAELFHRFRFGSGQRAGKVISRKLARMAWSSALKLASSRASTAFIRARESRRSDSGELWPSSSEQKSAQVPSSNRL